MTFVAREAIRMEGYFPLQARPQRGFVRVTLSTKRDLGALADRYDLNLWHEAGYCPSRAFDELDSDGPFWRELALPLGSTREEEEAYRSAARPEADGRYRYDIYLAPVRMGPSNLSYGGRPPAGPYDLVRDGKNVCLTIGGGNMAGGLFRSNVVVVPYRTLRVALANGGA